MSKGGHQQWRAVRSSDQPKLVTYELHFFESEASALEPHTVGFHRRYAPHAPQCQFVKNPSSDFLDISAANSRFCYEDESEAHTDEEWQVLETKENLSRQLEMEAFFEVREATLTELSLRIMVEQQHALDTAASLEQHPDTWVSWEPPTPHLQHPRLECSSPRTPSVAHGRSGDFGSRRATDSSQRRGRAFQDKLSSQPSICAHSVSRPNSLRKDGGRASLHASFSSTLQDSDQSEDLASTSEHIPGIGLCSPRDLCDGSMTSPRRSRATPQAAPSSQLRQESPSVSETSQIVRRFSQQMSLRLTDSALSLKDAGGQLSPQQQGSCARDRARASLVPSPSRSRKPSRRHKAQEHQRQETVECSDTNMLSLLEPDSGQQSCLDWDDADHETAMDQRHRAKPSPATIPRVSQADMDFDNAALNVTNSASAIRLAAALGIETGTTAAGSPQTQASASSASQQRGRAVSHDKKPPTTVTVVSGHDPQIKPALQAALGPCNSEDKFISFTSGLEWQTAVVDDLVFQRGDDVPDVYHYIWDNGGFGIYASGYEHALWADADEDVKDADLPVGSAGISSLEQAAVPGSPTKQTRGSKRDTELVGSRRSAQGVPILPGKAFRVPRTTPHTTIHNIGPLRRLPRTGSLSPLGFSSSDSCESDGISVGSMGSTLLRAPSPGPSSGPQILLDLNIDLSSLEAKLRSSASDPFLAFETSEPAFTSGNTLGFPKDSDRGPATTHSGASPHSSPSKKEPRGFMGFVRGLSMRRRSEYTATSSDF